MKCPVCERGTLIDMTKGKTFARECDRCRVTVTSVPIERYGRRFIGYASPRDEMRDNSLARYAHTKKDKE